MENPGMRKQFGSLKTQKVLLQTQNLLTTNEYQLLSSILIGFNTKTKAVKAEQESSLWR